MTSDALGAQDEDLDVRGLFAFVTHNLDLFHGLWFLLSLLRHASLVLDGRHLALGTRVIPFCHVLEAVPVNLMSATHVHLHTFHFNIELLVAVSTKLYDSVLVQVTRFILDANVARQTMEEVVTTSKQAFCTLLAVELLF